MEYISYKYECLSAVDHFYIQLEIPQASDFQTCICFVLWEQQGLAWSHPLSHGPTAERASLVVVCCISSFGTS